jgi:hypothetical protein
VDFARRIAHYLDTSAHYELINRSPVLSGDLDEKNVHPIIPLNIVLFRGSHISPFPPNDPSSAANLTNAINDTRRMYVTGTKWRGEGAIRLAVSNWRTGSGIFRRDHGGTAKNRREEVSLRDPCAMRCHFEQFCFVASICRKQKMSTRDCLSTCLSSILHSVAFCVLDSSRLQLGLFAVRYDRSRIDCSREYGSILQSRSASPPCSTR